MDLVAGSLRLCTNVAPTSEGRLEPALRMALLEGAGQTSEMSAIIASLILKSIIVGRWSR